MNLGPRYEVLRELGSGGAGRVFLVRDEHLGARVALKLLHEKSVPAAGIEKLKSEFTLLAGMEHPGIARAHDFGFLDGRPYFTSEYVPGKPLGVGGPRRTLDAGAFLRDARAIASALAFLHRSEILHLDIKPGNVLVPPGKRGPVIIDFGLFRSGLCPIGDDRCAGSLPYMAPEYFRGTGLGPFTDVYALGVTLYRVATGVYPRLGACAEGGPSWDPVLLPPSHRGGGLPRGFDDVVLKCLALDPDRRYGSGEELARALSAVIGKNGVNEGPPDHVRASLRTVGRETELAAIDRFLDACPRGTGNPSGTGPPVLLVTGARGMGQSRLFAEMKVRAQTRGLAFYLETGYPGAPSAPGAVLRCLSRHMAPPSRAAWDAFLSGLRRPRAPRADDSQAEARRRRAEHVARCAGALRLPLVLGIDGLQYLDEVSVELLADLIRFVHGTPEESRPPLHVALGYREEGLLARLLSELTEHLLEPGGAEVIALHALGPRESLELHEETLRSAEGRSRDEPTAPHGLAIFQRTGGVPAAIVELSKTGPAAGGELSSTPARIADASEPRRVAERRLLLALGSLEKPSTAAELARISRMAPAAARRKLEEWRAAGIIAEEEGGWIAGPPARRIAPRSDAERRDVHRSIAREILSKASRPDDPRRLRAVHHLRLAGDNAWIRKHALGLARHLKSIHRTRAALEVLEAAASALPRRSTGAIEAALEMADLRARLGHVDEGIDALNSLLPEVQASRLTPWSTQAATKRRPPGEARGPSRLWRTRIHLRLGMLHSRRGDLRRADALFEEGLAAARAPGSGIRREEVLFFLNEHAAAKAFVGQHEEAIRLCSDGLRIAASARDLRARELALNFHATRGNVHLRRFEFDEASRDLEKALDIAHATGSLTNRAIILNNLGIVQGQCDRYRDAVRTYREAERICFRIDDGPSLVYVRGNLALVHAKMGDFESSERLFDEIERSCAGRAAEESRREVLFLEHHRALSLMYRGRHGEARPRLERAARIASAVGDRFIEGFDSVYAAECLVFEAEYPEAVKRLEACSLPELPARVRRMALARLALARAWMGDADGLNEAIDRHAALPSGREVAVLDAWDDLFLGWSLSIASAGGRARPYIDRAVSRFQETGVRPGAALASWIAAEALFLEGKPREADALLEQQGPSSDLTRALWPLLQARLCLEPFGDPATLERCADRLADAGGALLEARLPEWSSRLDALRRAIEPRGEARSGAASAAADRPRSAHWKAWTEGPWRAAPPAAGRRGRRAAGSNRTSTARILTRARHSIAARSPAMRKLLVTLDRLRGSDLPVLISGETGTGKEMVARLIHDESRRFAGPFRVLDCAAIPRGLIETEVFGARAGAFTDLTEDRRGILVEAEGGTILVDEIAEAAPEVQAKLLRVLSQGAVRPVGADREVKLDVRFIFSSRRDLEGGVEGGGIRADLLHRIRVLTVTVPPLRERREDVEDLVKTILSEARVPPPALEAGIIERLRLEAWPGNVRELRNLVLRLVVEHPERIPLAALDAPGSPPGARRGSAFPEELLQSERLEHLKDRLEREYALHHLQRLGGDMGALSRFLGLSPKHCYRRLRELGISLRDEQRRRRRPER